MGYSLVEKLASKKIKTIMEIRFLIRERKMGSKITACTSVCVCVYSTMVLESNLIIDFCI